MNQKSKLSHVLKNTPVFLFLLPLFFVLHGFTANYYEVPAGTALLLFLTYTAVAWVVAGIAWLFFRNVNKSALFALLLMAFHFFYGSIQDLIQQQLLIQVRYRYLFAFILIFFIAAAYWLKKRQRPLQTLTNYLNILFVVIILGDMVWLATTLLAPAKLNFPEQPSAVLRPCDTCYKPDIFFIIPDQYAGNDALRSIFGFDNAAFEKELENRGFYIASNSRSNYNLTPFSVASTLNMDYIAGRVNAYNKRSVSHSYQLIRNNCVLKYLTAMDYRFFNCSVFNFPGQPAHEYGAFLPYGAELITAQTFTGRLEKDFRADILAGRFGKSLQQDLAYEYLHFNEDILDLTRQVAAMQSTSPKFVYTHLMMPHFPYYFDSRGNPLPIGKLGSLQKTNKKDFIEYLRYTNQKILHLVDHILTHSPTPPVIMILGDHGYRLPEKSASRQYDFINLNASYFPGKKYEGYYDSVSNVNQFRIFFNTWFQQQLPMLKDSTVDVIN